MQNNIQHIIYSYLPSSKKTTTGGWVAFNAVCCIYQGESQDKKRRGGVIFGGDGGVTYHCFNCQFKTSWRPGRGISVKFRKWLSWINMPQNEIDNLRLQVLKFADERLIKPKPAQVIKFEAADLPEGTATFAELATWYAMNEGVKLKEPAETELHELLDVVNYAEARCLLRHPNEHLAWCPQSLNRLNRRLIIPFRYQNQIVGYTARCIDSDAKPKYITSTPNGYVFNMDAQTRERQFVIVCEGPIDALSVDGVAVLSNNINETQIQLINSLQRKVIVVPDYDKSGKNLIDVALENKWSVSFPAWWETCKDINQSCVKYGKLFTLKNILDNTVDSVLKIELMKKRHNIWNTAQTYKNYS